MSLLSVLGLIAACAVVVWGAIWLDDLVDEHRGRPDSKCEDIQVQTIKEWVYKEFQDEYLHSEQAGKGLTNLAPKEERRKDRRQ